MHNELRAPSLRLPDEYLPGSSIHKVNLIDLAVDTIPANTSTLQFNSGNLLQHLLLGSMHAHDTIPTDDVEEHLGTWSIHLNRDSRSCI